MKRFMMAVIATALVGGLVLVPADEPKKGDETKKADEKAPDTKPTALSEETKQTQLAVAAFAMAAEGRRTKSPEMLLAAARVIGKTNFGKFTEKELADSNKATPVEGKLEAAALLKEAIDLGGDNADSVKKMAAVVEADIKARTKGSIPGPRSINGILQQELDRTDTFHITFRGGEPAQITVNNLSNRGDINLVVYDKNGRFVVGDFRKDDDCGVTFFPNATQTYKVLLVCRRSGDAILRYRLTTN